MTENKRFSVKKSESGLFYRDGDYEIDNTIQFIIETVEMKLNQLSDENEQLKQHNAELVNKIDFLERVIDGDVWMTENKRINLAKNHTNGPKTAKTIIEAIQWANYNNSYMIN